MPAKVTDEQMRILTQVVEANKIEKNGQICTNWEKVISNFINQFLFVVNCVFIMLFHFKVSEEYSALSGETLCKKKVRNRWVNRVIKYANEAQKLNLTPYNEESAIKVNELSSNPWCVPICNKQLTQKNHVQQHIDMVHKKLRPAKISDEQMRILTQVVEANKFEKNGQICTNWEKVSLISNCQFFFVVNDDF